MFHHHFDAGTIKTFLWMAFGCIAFVASAWKFPRDRGYERDDAGD